MGGQIRGRALAGRYGRGRFVGPDVSAGGVTPPPGPSCSITLNGDIAAVVGATAADISGQTFSVTDVTFNNQSDVYIAATPLVVNDWADSEIRLLGTKNWGKVEYTRGNEEFGFFPMILSPAIGFISGDYTKQFQIILMPAVVADPSNPNPLAQVIYILGQDAASGNVAGNAFGGISPTYFEEGDQITAGVDGTGAVHVYKNGEPLEIGYYNGSLTPIPAFPFLGEGNFYVGGSIALPVSFSSDDPVTGITVSGTFAASGADILFPHPAAVRDWCGNDTVEKVPLPSMVAGYLTMAVGEQVVEAWGYLASAEIGSLSGAPLAGQVMRGLYVESLDGSVTRRLAEFTGDATTALAGKSLYLDGVQYPITEVNYYAGTNYTEALIPTLPTFTDGVTYTVEFK